MPLHRRLYRKRNFGLITLDAFPKTHQSKDVKLSFDRKEVARPAVGFGTVGDEDGSRRKFLIKWKEAETELNIVRSVISSLPADDFYHQQSLDMQDEVTKNALLIIISDISSRIKELQNLILIRNCI